MPRTPAQGQRLRELLDFRGRYIDKTVAAQVIGTSGTDQARDIFIDKGSKDGLQVQMPVITPDGIVGKVKNVFPHTAQVLLISDQTSGTGRAAGDHASPRRDEGKYIGAAADDQHLPRRADQAGRAGDHQWRRSRFILQACRWEWWTEWFPIPTHRMST